MFYFLSVKPYETQQSDFLLAWQSINTSDSESIAETHLISCWVLMDDEKKVPIGRFAFYINPELNYEDKKIGAVGKYACIDDNEAAKALFGQVEKIARESDCNMVIGPFDGSTWNDYRLNTKQKSDSFFLEPNYPTYYNTHFQQAGFAVLATYYSQATEVLSRNEDALNAQQQKYESAGAIFRQIDLGNYKEELEKIAHFSNKAFKENFLFSPIAIESFVEKYLMIKPIIDPTFVYLVNNQEGDLWALCFAIKNLNDPTGKTLIIKTLARTKDAPLKGIAYFLGAKTGAEAAKKGYTKVIHALMRSDNASRDASKRIDGEVISEYVLYGKIKNG